jgi:hypothetical protein
MSRSKKISTTADEPTPSTDGDSHGKGTVMFDNLIDKTDNKKLLALEKTIEEGLRTFNEVGTALLMIRDEKLYRGEYKTFEEYCDQKWNIDRSRAYQLIDSAEVVATLKMSTTVDILPTSERQTRPLALLPSDKQVEAWREATKKAPHGEQPTGGLVQKIVNRIRSKTSTEKRLIKASEGWTTEELKEDTELFEAFKSIASVYGNEDAKAIRTGVVQMKRADVLFLAKLPKETMLEIHELILVYRWTPKHAIKCVNETLENTDPIEHLIHRCLRTKSKFWKGDVGAFTITCKWNPPPTRSQ